MARGQKSEIRSRKHDEEAKQMRQRYHMMNMAEWPSLYSVYLQEGGRIPGDWLDDDFPDPPWSSVPPVAQDFYWVFDIATRTIAVLHLYRLDDETVEDPLTINVFGLPGMNPDVDVMTGKVLYGPSVWDDETDWKAATEKRKTTE